MLLVGYDKFDNFIFNCKYQIIIPIEKRFQTMFSESYSENFAIICRVKNSFTNKNLEKKKKKKS